MGSVQSAKLCACLYADLVILLERGNNQLVVQLAEDMAHDQINRAANTTVGARFREQLRDLIARLDKCAATPCLTLCTCSPSHWSWHGSLHVLVL